MLEQQSTGGWQSAPSQDRKRYMNSPATDLQEPARPSEISVQMQRQLELVERLENAVSFLEGRLTQVTQPDLPSTKEDEGQKKPDLCLLGGQLRRNNDALEA